jgi:hypothetical protein
VSGGYQRKILPPATVHGHSTQSRLQVNFPNAEDAKPLTFALRHGVAGVGSNIQGLERQNYPIFGNPGGFQIERDSGLGSVSLDPEFPVDQVNMDHAPVDAALVPADAQQEVMVAFTV